MEKENPLDIPEIHSLIASFLPIWEEGAFGKPKSKLTPRHLLSCTLVSRFWRRVLLPHLWALYSPELMDKVLTKVA